MGERSRGQDHRGHRGGGRGVHHPLGRRTPSCRQSRTLGSARSGARGTSEAVLECGLGFAENAGSRHDSRGSSYRWGTYGQPDSDVGVSWGTGATSVLLVTEGADHDWVCKGT